MMNDRSNSRDEREGQTESAPLLSQHAERPGREEQRQLEDGHPGGVDGTTQPTPLPVVQLAVICLMRLTEHAGIVESVFAFVQFLTIFQWGRLSDRIGRKPVLLIGLTGTAISVSAFGFAHSLLGMVLARSIAGALNGNIGVLKSTLAEMTDESNQARAFSLIPLCYAVGSIIGPIMGAWLSEPADTFPALDTPFWRENPYFLPCAAAGSLNLLAAIFGFFFLTETLPSKVLAKQATSQRRVSVPPVLTRVATLDAPSAGVETPPLAHRISEGDLQEARQLRRQSSQRSVHGYGATGAAQNTTDTTQLSSNPDEPEPPKVTVRSLLTKDRFRVLSSQMLLNFLNISYVVLLPLMCYEEPDVGGAGFSKADIGNLLALNGVITMMVQLLLFPPMERKLGGPRNVIQRVLLLLPLVYILFPLANLAARTRGRSWTWFVFLLILPFKTISNTAAASATLLVINSAPHPSALGSLNGLSQTLASLARAFGPLVSTSLFAFSISHPRLLGGNLVWFLMGALSFVCWALTLRIPVAYNRRGINSKRRTR
ncbi:hypothetical protein A4X06_0g6540 [Tilletia controversa]|uniref:Major facilitator superfamily (MFS) profile domain-containing protein n=1 Tax=Tilletia controversa TaxID=13291 RepID=A0A8X7SUQ4_9BASI|nr:hypothetical protein CF328_g5630 [Tilletia controversa]KAE8194669.1 hypothetical protein CF335_g5291 [Tilletia laevis]KAE8243123.1 hypothetical protein A4X06_0g6540 [Tilletia controversa]